MTRSLRAVAVLTAGLAAACGDAPTEPAALQAAEHARAVLDIPVALPSLAEAELMEGVEFDGVVADLGIWLDAAEARLEAEPGADAGLAELRGARIALREAARLEKAGDRAGAVKLLADAEARVVGATARALTEGYLAAADAAAARCDAAGPGDVRDEVAVRRGRRLLAHAREAQAEDDLERAVQRAHYAEVLLAGECPAAPAGKE